jgi:predicted DNA binding CopG/RHH family protein
MKENTQTDPFDDIDDDEFDQLLERAFAERPESVSVSLRMPRGLLGRVKRAAERRDMPYQTLIKRVLEAGVETLERSESKSRRRRRHDSDPQIIPSRRIDPR